MTAEIIARKTKSPAPVIFPDLIERDFGIMTGESESRVTELCFPEVIQAGKINYFLSPEGAETFPELLVRAKRMLSEITKKHESGNILLTTHGDF